MVSRIVDWTPVAVDEAITGTIVSPLAAATFDSFRTRPPDSLRLSGRQSLTSLPVHIPRVVRWEGVLPRSGQRVTREAHMLRRVNAALC